ncbi:ATP-grasp domain-containing protein [Halovulum sp. GXIMD14794]
MPHVTWVLQSNAIGAADMDALLAHLREMQVRVETLRVVPFSHAPADPVPQITGPCVVYGSSGLLALARREGWSPAGWDGDGFSASCTVARYGDRALNHGAVRTTWAEAAGVARRAGWARVFTRPDAETKEFAGTVHSLTSLEAFAARLEASGYLEGQGADMIVAPARMIAREWRAFVVCGRIVAVSRYAVNGIPDPEPGAPEPVLRFLRESIDGYAPAPCFVLDVAEMAGDGALKVIEVNSINSSGFYAADKRAVLEAVTRHVAREIREQPGA